MPCVTSPHPPLLGRRAALLAELKRENERLKQETLAKLKQENEQLRSQRPAPTTAEDNEGDAADDDGKSSSSSSSDEDSDSSSDEDSDSSENQPTKPAPASKAVPSPAGEPDDAALLAFIKTKRSFWLKYIRASNVSELGNDPNRHSEATRRGFWREQTGAAVATSSTSKRAAEPAPAPAPKKPKPTTVMKPAPEKLQLKEFAGVGIDLSAYSGAAELLQAHGADALKAELQRLGLKCGGKPMERAERLLASGGRSADELKSSFLLKSAPATKSVLPSDLVRRRNELQKKKRESGGSSAEVTNPDSSDDAGTTSDDSSDDEVAEKQDALPTVKAAGATPKVSDEEVLEVIKNNRVSWLRWIKKHDLEKEGKDPMRHTPATRRKFYKDPHAKKVLPGQPAKPAKTAKPTPTKNETKPAAKKAHANSAPVSPAGAPTKRSSKMSVILARAREYGVEQAELDDAMDAVDPREAVVRVCFHFTAALDFPFVVPTTLCHIDPMMKFRQFRCEWRI